MSARYNLLIADDEQNILHSMETYVRTHSTRFSEIYCAPNGQRAIELILQHRPEVMLLDMQMPVKNGLQVMQECIAAGVCPRTVILSGYDTFSYAQQALRLGAVDYLLKPCRSADILRKMESLLPEMMPEQPPESQNELICRAIDYCKQHIAEEITLGDTAASVGVSPAYLSQLFSRNQGGFVEYLTRLRIGYACDYMKNSVMKVYEIAFAVGFRDEKYFSRVFRRITGKSPSEYRRALYQGTPENRDANEAGRAL